MPSRLWPALDVHADSNPDMVIAAADDFGPTAVAGRFRTSPIEVSDEDWARRSQEGLAPITVDRIRIVPEPATGPDDRPTIVVQPSMGFGTGHHETTRLCVAALQQIDVRGAVVLDVGTGSGVLALASAVLGASEVLGLDSDPDAVRCAQDNLVLNPGLVDRCRLAFQARDVIGAPLPLADVVLANLTGALLVRAATRLADAVRPGGALIVSGLLIEERDAVRGAFARLEVWWEARESEWAALGFRRAAS
jgi:ribosomal protein L11 methyltransferase